MDLEPEEILLELLKEELIIVNNGWWDKDWPKDKITIAVICNDVFAWGCADAEELLYHELAELYKMHKRDPKWGCAAFCIKKRRQMPQKPLEEMMVKDGIWNLKELIEPGYPPVGEKK